VSVDHLDLAYDEDQVVLADSVRGWLVHRAAPSATAGDSWPAGLWRGLADLGVLGLGTPDGGGGALEIAAVMEVLGELATPGPLAGTFLAGQLLGDEQLAPVVAGDALVAVGKPPLVPWAAVAEVFVELDGAEAWLAEPVGPVEPVATLAGEPWGRVTLRRTARLEGAERAVALGDVAVGAYLVGAAQHLTTISSDWARDRVQFGRPIGDFQSVAHPLTDVFVRTRAARNLVRSAAYALDHDELAAEAVASSATARLSATRAAVDATYRAHQAFGALGFTVEGPVAAVGQRIRQISLHPPGPGAAREAVLAGLGL
jgi:alkylation response protein AidB-like acyl-CoA dehydrogenase